MASRQAYSKIFEVEKPVIGYARFGRVLKFNKYLFILQLTLLVFVFELLVIFFLEDYFRILSDITGRILEDSYTGSYKFLSFKLEYSISHGRLPTLWLIYVSFVYFVSSFYFVFFSNSFPYLIRKETLLCSISFSKLEFFYLYLFCLLFLCQYLLLAC